jgi:hypothetical protein
MRQVPIGILQKGPPGKRMMVRILDDDVCIRAAYIVEERIKCNYRRKLPCLTYGLARTGTGLLRGGQTCGVVRHVVTTAMCGSFTDTCHFMAPE